jgi:hypothetical protein
MSLYVDIRVHDRVIATASISNLSDLSDESDYVVSVTEYGNKRLGIPFLNKQWLMKGHNRNQTVWALIAKVAQSAVLEQNR